jgi:hypothetical protein
MQMVSLLSNTGGFGLVHKGVVRGSEVAIKIPRNALSEKQINDFTKEVAILSSGGCGFTRAKRRLLAACYFFFFLFSLSSSTL